jgi:RNA polymerase sigma-70 factor (ECF subfamily)
MTDSIDRLYTKVLVLRFQAGEVEAFEELVSRHSQALRYFLTKLLGRDRVDDALQDVWLGVIRGVDKLKDPASFTPWLYRIARNRAYQEMRADYHEHPTALQEEPVDVTTEIEFSSEEAQHIDQALSMLTPEQREVLTLRFVEGMSYEELAAVVGCPVGTIRSRIHYAKQALRQQIERKIDDER